MTVTMGEGGKYEVAVLALGNSTAYISTAACPKIREGFFQALGQIDFDGVISTERLCTAPKLGHHRCYACTTLTPPHHFKVPVSWTPKQRAWFYQRLVGGKDCWKYLPAFFQKWMHAERVLGLQVEGLKESHFQSVEEWRKYRMPTLVTGGGCAY